MIFIKIRIKKKYLINFETKIKPYGRFWDNDNKPKNMKHKDTLSR